MIRLTLISLALLLELTSWITLCSADAPRRVPLYFLAHGVAAAVLALGLGQGERASTAPRWRALLLRGVVGFFLPLVGVPALAIGALPALRSRPAPEESAAVKLTGVPALPANAGAGLAAPGTDGADAGLALRRGQEVSVRLRAVLASGKRKDAPGVSILTTALRDRDDEVRLLAYALLDGKEREISTRIAQDLKALAQAEIPLRPRLHARIAHLHWELVYLGLAQGEVARHVLGQARGHAEAAVAADVEDASTQLLLGRIALREGRPGAAEEALQRAAAGGLPAEKVAPYLAEAAYRARRFDQVRTRVNGQPGPDLAQVMDFWL